MGFYKIILVVICGICMSLTGCSASFCGFGQGEELVFSCEEPLIESATAQETEPEKEEETSAAVSKEQMADTPTALPDTRIDLNLATVEELVTLKGIGESRAEAIVEYRTQQGPFTCIEDIMQVAGIKEGVFSKIKDQIVVH